jgi:alkaline phosphatase D
MEWLLDALSFSRASFKFIVVGGQVLSPAAVYENHAQLGEERMQLIEAIRAENIPGVIFLSGDRHHSELTKYALDRLYPLYDFTVSPLTSGTGNPSSDENPLRVSESLVTERNYGLIRVSGPQNKRVLQLQLKDKEGARLWSYEIRQEDLK